jgi:alpha-D-ribose 1-methylphosphonate 5-triphosphate diphosphatase
MPTETALTHARIVTRDEIVEGTALVRGGVIAAVEPGRAQTAAAFDLDGDYLIPGLVELHTDNLEKHYAPRIGVVWDAVSAAVSHDVQCAGSGITTVFDSLVIGANGAWETRDAWLRPMLDGVDRARAAGMLKADHRLHLRCEVTHPDIVPFFERFLAEPALGFMSLMDHAPGDRQSPDVAAYKRRLRGAFGMDEAAAEAQAAGLIEASRTHGPRNRRRVAAIARARGLPLASHDDAREEHIVEAVELGAVLTEFPTALAAARARGLHVLVGGPILIRGGSHSGNVAAEALAREGLLDVLSSDYVPASLLMAALDLPRRVPGIGLCRAVATVTRNPARATGLADRGEIAAGMRADLVRVHRGGEVPVVRQVWRGGERTF